MWIDCNVLREEWYTHGSLHFWDILFLWILLNNLTITKIKINRVFIDSDLEKENKI